MGKVLDFFRGRSGAPSLPAIDRNWIETRSGRQFHFLDPRPGEIVLDDIAESLAKACRYGGHCIGHYSVAEHATIIADWLFVEHGCPTLALQGLHHDDSEAYLVDLNSPIKPHLPGYKALELPIQAAIYRELGLPEREDPRVKAADKRIVLDERRQVMRPSQNHWWAGDGLEPLYVRVQSLEWKAAKAAYLSTHEHYASML